METTQGCTERSWFPLRAYTGVYHDRCGRSATPSSTQLDSVGRLLLFG